jgi:hypothetical protein
MKSFGALLAAVLACTVVPSVAGATAPETVVLSGPSGVISSSTATFAFAVAGDDSGSASFQCRLDSSGAWEACASPVTYTDLADGEHHFEVRTKYERHHGWGWHHGWHWDDSWDCFGTPVEVDFTVDTTAPQTTIDAAPVGTIGTSEAIVEFSAEEPAGNPEETAATPVLPAEELAGNVEEAPDTFECLLDNAPAGWAPCSSPIHLSGLKDGSHTFEVRAVDAVGNVDPTAAATTFAVDTTLPETTVETAPAARIDIDEASFTFSSAEATVFECRLDPQPTSPWEPCTPPVSIAGLSEGEHTFEVRAGDRFGRFDPTPARVTFFVDIPVNGARLEAAPLAGTVRIKAPGATNFRTLTEGETIAVGSVVDTTEGKVSLTSVDPAGEEQRASFFQGTFRVGQQLGRRLVTLQLRGANFSQCGSEEEDEGAARASSKPPGQSLWGSGHGSFRTEGHFGSATVRGTIWLTSDTCEGTLVKVNRGLVAVRDYRRHKTILVPAGHSYLAKSPAA